MAVDDGVEVEGGGYAETIGRIELQGMVIGRRQKSRRVEWIKAELRNAILMRARTPTSRMSCYFFLSFIFQEEQSPYLATAPDGFKTCDEAVFARSCRFQILIPESAPPESILSSN